MYTGHDSNLATRTHASARPLLVLRRLLLFRVGLLNELPVERVRQIGILPRGTGHRGISALDEVGLVGARGVDGGSGGGGLLAAAGEGIGGAE